MRLTTFGVADDDAEFEVDRERLVSGVGAAEQGDPFVGGDQLGVQGRPDVPITGRRFSGQAAPGCPTSDDEQEMPPQLPETDRLF
jgi:hypothetical protein